MNKFRDRFLSIVCIFSLGFGVGCKDNDKEDNDGDGGSGGNLNLKIESSGLSLGGLAFSLAGENCGPANGQAQGKCYTPTAVKGFFNTASISKLGSAGQRILGGGDKYHGLESVFRTAAFDVSKSVYIDGDDNLQDAGEATYDTVSIGIQAIDLQFTAAGKVFNTRTVFVNQPGADDPIFTDCIDSGGLEEAKKYGNFYSAPSEIMDGDILLCIKDSVEETCEDDEYLWIDDAPGYALTETRPDSPIRLTGSYVGSETSCTAGSEHPEVTWGSVNLYASMSKSVTIDAKLDRSEKIYTVDSVSGNALNLTLDLDFSNSIFVPSDLVAAFESDDYETNGASIREALETITLVQIFEYNNMDSSSDVIETFMGASLALDVQTISEEDDDDVEDLSETF